MGWRRLAVFCSDSDAAPHPMCHLRFSKMAVRRPAKETAIIRLPCLLVAFPWPENAAEAWNPCTWSPRDPIEQTDLP